MTQHEFDTLVASATGESLRTIATHGFTLADPLRVDHDPEPPIGRHIDWDHLQAERQVAVLPR